MKRNILFPTPMATVCPFCGHKHDTASLVGKRAKPKQGDATICIQCGEWSFFDAMWTGGLRRPTFAEYESLVTRDDTKALRRAWVEASVTFKGKRA